MPGGNHRKRGKKGEKKGGAQNTSSKITESTQETCPSTEDIELKIFHRDLEILDFQVNEVFSVARPLRWSFISLSFLEVINLVFFFRLEILSWLIPIGVLPLGVRLIFNKNMFYLPDATQYGKRIEDITTQKKSRRNVCKQSVANLKTI